MGGAIDTHYLIGLGTLDNRMLILADIDRLVSSDDGASVDLAAAAG